MTKNIKSSTLEAVLAKTTVDKLFALQQRFIALNKQARDLDYAQSEWARDCRAVWPAGVGGDTSFMKWAINTLTNQQGEPITPHEANALLNRSKVASMVQNSKEWAALGGYRSLRKVLDLPESKQAAAVREALSTGKRTYSVPDGRLASPKLDYTGDIAKLANYLNPQKNLPPDIRVIVDMYKTKR